MINELMEAIHDIPQQLTAWAPDGLDTLRLHLRCFDSKKHSEAPNLVLFFEDQLAEYNNQA